MAVAEGDYRFITEDVEPILCQFLGRGELGPASGSSVMSFYFSGPLGSALLNKDLRGLHLEVHDSLPAAQVAVAIQRQATDGTTIAFFDESYEPVFLSESTTPEELTAALGY